MHRTRSTLLGSATAVTALLLAVGPLAGIASATGSHGKDSARTASVTEDNDTNDGGTRNNVVDDGDNRHPSGKDRSVERGGSGNQGNTGSDPDDDGRGPDRSNGGADRPGGAGGVDLADQDGNNGCGNDDDFEDDNEGWCGRKRDKASADKASEGSVKARPVPSDHAGKSATGKPVCVVDMAGTKTGEGCAKPAGSICLLVGHPPAAAVNAGFAKVVVVPADLPKDQVAVAAAALAAGNSIPRSISVLATVPAEVPTEVLSAGLVAAAPASGQPAPAVLAAAAGTGAPGGSLPVTGGSLSLAAIALAALLAGGLLIRAGRDRTA